MGERIAPKLFYPAAGRNNRKKRIKRDRQCQFALNPLEEKTRRNSKTAEDAVLDALKQWKRIRK